MDWLRIDNTDVGALCLLLLAAAAAGYLASVPRKSPATRWLTGLVVALAAHLALALAASLADLARVGSAGAVLLGADAALLALSAAAGVGLAYARLPAPPARQARWAVGAALAATAGLTALLVLRAAGLPLQPRPLAAGAYGLAALGYVGAAAVLLRHARGAEAPRPGDRERSALRAHAAVFVVGALAAGAGYAVRFEGAPPAVSWLCLLVLLLGLLTLHVTYGPEPSTLQAKVVAFVLAAALAALTGAVALGNRPDDLARSSGILPPEHEAVRFVPRPDGGYRVEPAAVAGGMGAPIPGPPVWGGRSVDLGFAFPFGGRSWTSIRVFPTGYVAFGDALGPDAPVIAPLYAPPSADEWDAPRVFVRHDPERTVVSWLAVVSGAADEHAQVHLVLEASGALTLHYGDAGFVRSLTRAVLPLGSEVRPLRLEGPGPLPPTVPAAGVLQTIGPDYAAHTSRRLVPWVWLAFGVTGVVVVGLPLLLRASVTRPLARLLDGVRRVESGDLSAEVPVEAPDEVGRLTAHFNRMTGALRQANADLRAHAETLETRVEERTAALAASNADLAAEKAALARALDDLHRAQAQLVQQEKLASLGRLTSGIAHEIKNPLNFVVNFADLSRDLAGDLLADADARPDTPLADVRDDLDDLRSNAERVGEHGRRADGIVRAMMDHAQGGAEAVQPVDFNALVEDHVRLATEARGDALPVEVTRAYGDDVGAVAVTPRALGRVVVNLVANALDAVAERNGTPRPDGVPAGVTVRTRRVEGAVELVVSDGGVGVAPDALPRLFEPFYTTKPTGQGNVGLGLSLARDVVVGHGGTLEAHSVEGEGATFTVSLPTDEPEA